MACIWSEFNIQNKHMHRIEAGQLVLDGNTRNTDPVLQLDILIKFGKLGRPVATAAYCF